MKLFSLIAFVLIVIAQWFVPTSIILKKEEILKNGKAFKFKTEPIDPSNPFEGKYISLKFQQDTFSLNKELEKLSNGDEIFVVLKQENGYAVISQVLVSKPKGNIDFVKASLDYIENYENNKRIHINYTFNKFFMEESKAPKAEVLYNKASQKNKNNCYALVYTKDGSAVVSDVLVNDTSISKLVK